MLNSVQSTGLIVPDECFPGRLMRVYLGFTVHARCDLYQRHISLQYSTTIIYAQSLGLSTGKQASDQNSLNAQIMCKEGQLHHYICKSGWNESPFHATILILCVYLHRLQSEPSKFILLLTPCSVTNAILIDEPRKSIPQGREQHF